MFETAKRHTAPGAACLMGLALVLVVYVTGCCNQAEDKRTPYQKGITTHAASVCKGGPEGRISASDWADLLLWTHASMTFKGEKPPYDVPFDGQQVSFDDSFGSDDQKCRDWLKPNDFKGYTDVQIRKMLVESTALEKGGAARTKAARGLFKGYIKRSPGQDKKICKDLLGIGPCTQQPQGAQE